MKTLSSTSKFKLHKTIVTRFTKPGVAGAAASSSILNTTSRGGAQLPA